MDNENTFTTATDEITAIPLGAGDNTEPAVCADVIEPINSIEPINTIDPIGGVGETADEPPVVPADAAESDTAPEKVGYSESEYAQAVQQAYDKGYNAGFDAGVYAQSDSRMTGSAPAYVPVRSAAASGDEPGKGLAIAGLVLGIVSVLFPYFHLAFVCLACGIIGLCLTNAAKKKGFEGGMQKGAQVVAIIGIVISFVSIAFMLTCYGCMYMCSGTYY